MIFTGYGLNFQLLCGKTTTTTTTTTTSHKSTSYPKFLKVNKIVAERCGAT